MYIIEYYSSRMKTWNTQQYLKEDLLILSRYFMFFYLIILFYINSLQTLVYKETSPL